MHFSNRDDRQVAEVEVESLKGKKINLFICLGLASADFGINTFKDYITCICVSVIFDGGVVHSQIFLNLWFLLSRRPKTAMICILWCFPRFQATSLDDVFTS